MAAKLADRGWPAARLAAVGARVELTDIPRAALESADALIEDAGAIAEVASAPSGLPRRSTMGHTCVDTGENPRPAKLNQCTRRLSPLLPGGGILRQNYSGRS
jgi:hypothetical protein